MYALPTAEPADPQCLRGWTKGHALQGGGDPVGCTGQPGIPWCGHRELLFLPTSICEYQQLNLYLPSH